MILENFVRIIIAHKPTWEDLVYFVHGFSALLSPFTISLTSLTVVCCFVFISKVWNAVNTNWSWPQDDGNRIRRETTDV